MSPARPRSPQSAVRSPQSAVRSPQSAVRKKLIALLFGATLTVVACTEESALPTDSTADPVLSGAPAADPQLLNALMINGGCRDASGSDGALTMVLAAPGGSARRYDCTAIGRDSMFTLARSYRSLARRVPGVIRAQTAPVGGSWEPYSYEREYCRISGNTGAVLYCGIFFTESGWVWIGDGGDAGGSVGGSGNGGPTSSPTVSPTPQPDEVPLEEVATVCPDLDPTCRVRPDTAQIRMMEDAFNSRFVSRFEYADSAVRAQCDTARNALQSIMGTLQTGDGPIWVGTSDAEPGTYLTPHEAEANQAANRFHLDPAVFDSIRTSPQSAFYSSKLLTLMLHERLHLDPYRFTHPVGDSILRGQRTAFASGNTYQVDPYFGPINSTAQGYRCVKF